jgi:glycosyltransferase involved in cell wall biosynthesis
VKIALFDYFVDGSNAIGAFHRMLVRGLAPAQRFHVFACRYADAQSSLADFVPVPVLCSRPLVLLAALYRLLARLVFWWRRLIKGERFDLVQGVEGNIGFADLAYAHFCHRFFLQSEWPNIRHGQSTARSLFRLWDHKLRAVFEPSAYRRARWIAVPSQGLKRELEATYPAARGKITVLPNPVNISFMTPDPNYQRDPWRLQHGIPQSATTLAFIALGHFERKGLPLLMEALQSEPSLNLMLMIVGGRADLVGAYRDRAGAMGLAEKLVFFGMQTDVRPFLWAADGFILPSFYEVFPTVALESAAAGLPVLSTPLNGVEEFLVDGENGLLMERSVQGVAEGLRRFAAMSAAKRHEMGARARASVAQYSEENFLKNWRALYARIEQELQAG